MTPAVNQVWVSRSDGERVLVVELPEGHPDRVLITPEEFRDHPDERRPRVALPVERLLADYRPEDEPPPAEPPAAVEVGSVVILKARCPNTPRMTVTRLDDGYGRVEVAYVPVYGEDGKVVRDKFPLSCLLPVHVHPRPEE